MLIIADGQPRGLGYIEVDHRNAAAPPPGVARYFEADTYTCSHCNRVVILNPQRTRERYKCAGCSHHICDDCAAERVAGKACRTFDQRATESLEQAARQAGTGNIILP